MSAHVVYIAFFRRMNPWARVNQGKPKEKKKKLYYGDLRDDLFMPQVGVRVGNAGLRTQSPPWQRNQCDNMFIIT